MLLSLLNGNANTAYGQRFGFASVKTVKDYQTRVPIAEYQDLAPYVDAAMRGEAAQLTQEQPILYTKTSGTTGGYKFIPATPESRRTKARILRLWIAALRRDHPDVFSAGVLAVVSPEKSSTAPDGTAIGSESGHGYRNAPKFAQKLFVCPYEVFQTEDYLARYYLILRHAVPERLSLIYTVNPSTLVVLAELMQQHTELLLKDIYDGGVAEGFLERMTAPLRDKVRVGLRPNAFRSRELERLAAQGEQGLLPYKVWPELKAIGCWKGGTVAPYIEKLRSLFPATTPIRDIGYLSSEMRGSLPMQDEGDSGPLTIDTTFFEFWPAEGGAPDAGNLLTADQLQAGRLYLPFVTTNAGLYRYNMHDIIEVTGTYHRSPLVRFVRKTEGIASFTGEKLTEDQVLQAVRETEAMFSTGGQFICAVGSNGARPFYIFLLEFPETQKAGRLAELARELDKALMRNNGEYLEKRSSYRLDPPHVAAVRRGELQKFRARRVASTQNDAQFKLVRVTTDSDFLKEFQLEQEVSAEEPGKRRAGAG